LIHDAPVKTGKEQVVQVHCDERVAIRIGPEPRVATREGVGEVSEIATTIASAVE
jgi:hypothetical protein